MSEVHPETSFFFGNKGAPVHARSKIPQSQRASPVHFKQGPEHFRHRGLLVGKCVGAFQAGGSCENYRGTSLIRNRPPIVPYGRASEVPL